VGPTLAVNTFSFLELRSERRHLIRASGPSTICKQKLKNPCSPSLQFLVPLGKNRSTQKLTSSFRLEKNVFVVLSSIYGEKTTAKPEIKQ
jgi:hypothetical protein